MAKVNFTYERGAMAEFLDELPELLLQYQQNQAQAAMLKQQREDDRAERDLREEQRIKEQNETKVHPYGDDTV